MNPELQDLISRLRNVIQTTCNTVGCDNCDLKWQEGCSATDLQEKIIDIQMSEVFDNDDNTSPRQ